MLIECEVWYYLYTPTDKTVVKIELIYYDNPKARESPSEEYLFDQNKLEVLKTLDTLEIDDFLNELSNIDSYGGVTGQILFSHDGKGNMITYDDGYKRNMGIQNLVDGFNELIERYF